MRCYHLEPREWNLLFCFIEPMSLDKKKEINTLILTSVFLWITISESSNLWILYSVNWKFGVGIRYSPVQLPFEYLPSQKTAEYRLVIWCLFPCPGLSDVIKVMLCFPISLIKFSNILFDFIPYLLRPTSVSNLIFFRSD